MKFRRTAASLAAVAVVATAAGCVPPGTNTKVGACHFQPFTPLRLHERPDVSELAGYVVHGNISYHCD